MRTNENLRNFCNCSPSCLHFALGSLCVLDAVLLFITHLQLKKKQFVELATKKKKKKILLYTKCNCIKKCLFSFSCLCMQRYFLKGPSLGEKVKRWRPTTFFINLHYSNITMVLIIRKCMFNRPALLINKGVVKSFSRP